ncbi:4'-phosphopantetheinyl transferase family protein [Shewanella aestuarii]|uniref:4'-phosphopantetheinyl transferase superfamily protein n=1 Tax=Shewanella aestuarii TaxID=1028752 RepID=A0A6G9QM93_9GAMM|nr:4'-phosphopantetheinyl transferase superfamily protein [Shewanella aestuarii]QIR14969.1 4'-phosphopantetheinyl transferase superfamily protein [Shewanella aestuarii]
MSLSNSTAKQHSELQTSLQPRVYFVPLTALSDAQFKAWLELGWLENDEIQKVLRYKLPLAQQKALQVRLALRVILSLQSQANSLAIRPQDWQFEYAEKGKPSLSHAFKVKTGLHFNLSHSGDWLMVGVLSSFTHVIEPHAISHELMLGVDIERLRSNTNIEPILKHYFTAQEIADLLVLTSDLQRERFFDLWALKEAFIKAIGKGLAQPLSSFRFLFTDNKVVNKEAQTLVLTEQGMINFIPPEPYQQPWHIEFGRLNKAYRFALCINCVSADIKTPIITESSLAHLLANNE